MRLFVVTSPATDVGKTFAACGLAAAAASLGVRSALLDFDLAVGDAVKAMGLEDEALRRPHPTVASWRAWPDPAAAALRGPGGAAVLPAPEGLAEGAAPEDVRALLEALSAAFDAAFADAGAAVGEPWWAELARAADAVLLVADCDDKALWRLRRFLSGPGRALAGKSLLVVNRRDPSGHSPRAFRRTLEREGFAPPVAAEIPHDRKAAAKGAAAVLDRKSPAGRALRELAAGLLGLAPAGAAAPGKRSLRLPFLGRGGEAPAAPAGEPAFAALGAPAGTGRPQASEGAAEIAAPARFGSAAGLSGGLGSGSAAAAPGGEPLDSDGASPPDAARRWDPAWESEAGAKARPTEGRPAPVDEEAEEESARAAREDRGPRPSGRVLLCLGAPRVDGWLAENLPRRGVEAAVAPPEELERGARPGDVAVLGRARADLVPALRRAGARVVLVLGPAAADEAAAFDADRVVWWPKGSGFKAEELLAIVAEAAGAGREAASAPETESRAGRAAERPRATGADGNSGREKEPDRAAGPGADAAAEAPSAGGPRGLGRETGAAAAAPRAARPGALLLGRQAQGLAAALAKAGWRVVTDPRDGPTAAVADADAAAFAPLGVPLVALCRGGVEAWHLRQARPDALVARSAEEALALLERAASGRGEEGEAAAAPAGPAEPGGGARGEAAEAARGAAQAPPLGKGRGLRLPYGSALYVVSPGSPQEAGKLAAALARGIGGERALVCAAADSAAALELGLKPEDLVLADWRVPGSAAPVEAGGGLWVWPVDPYKFLPVADGHAHSLVARVRGRFRLTVVDCGASLGLCSGAQPHGAGVLVLSSGGGIEGMLVRHWLRQNEGKRILVARSGGAVRLREGGDAVEVFETA